MYQHQFANPLPTTISYSMGSSNSSYEGFDHPVQGINNHCFDPNTSTLLHMLNPGNFHHDGFISEVPVDSVSAAASAVFYDPTIFHSVPNHGGGGSLVFEEGYGGRVNERMVQLGNKRKKKGFEEGAGGLKNEKQRRERLTNKFEVLKKLIPNPTKVLFLVALSQLFSLKNKTRVSPPLFSIAVAYIFLAYFLLSYCSS